MAKSSGKVVRVLVAVTLVGAVLLGLAIFAASRTVFGRSFLSGFLWVYSREHAELVRLGCVMAARIEAANLPGPAARQTEGCRFCGTDLVMCQAPWATVSCDDVARVHREHGEPKANYQVMVRKSALAKPVCYELRSATGAQLLDIASVVDGVEKAR